MASQEAKWSGSALFAIKYVVFYKKKKQTDQVYLTGWKLVVGLASSFIQHDKG